MSGSTASSGPTGSKVSIFAAKSGFVIPKNKLLGSLVLASKGGKKPGGSDATNEESTNQTSRKTKWGPDPTQDAAVRKGRTLAYQTRVDQIMQQLKSGIQKSGETQDSQVADQHASPTPCSPQTESKDLELLKLEWREIMGEILELNPSYKAPPDYEPLLKEATVPIPIKDHPRCNFVGLIFGPRGETKKRLEKETGAKIQVRGTKANTGEKVEISPSGENDPLVTYEELNVHVSADTFEKVDGAIALIDLLITSVSGSLVAGNNSNDLVQSQEAPTAPTGDQGAGQSAVIPSQTPQQVGFQYHGLQFSALLPQASGYLTSFIPIQNSSAPIHSSSLPVHLSPVNPLTMPSLSGPRPMPAPGFNPVLQNVYPLPPRQQLPMQVPPHPYQPRNFPIPTSQPSPAPANNLASLPFAGNQAPPTLPSPAVGPPLASALPQSVSNIPVGPPVRPLIPVGGSSGWSTAPTGGVAPSLGNSGQMVPPSVSFQGPRLVPQPGLPSSNMPAANLVSSVPLPTGPSTFNFPMNQPNGASRFASAPPRQMGSSSMPVPGSMPLLSPVASAGQLITQSATLGSFPVRAVNPSPARPPLASPIPRHSGPSDFTFQRHPPPNPASQLVSGPNSQSVIVQDTRFPKPVLPSSPQASPFRLAVPLPSPHNQMGQTQAHMPPVPFGGNSAGNSNLPRILAMSNTIPMLPPARNFSPASQLSNPAGPFPPRPSNPMLPITLRGNFLAPNQQSSNNFLFAPSSGGQQIYDPFSPT